MSSVMGPTTLSACDRVSYVVRGWEWVVGVGGGTGWWEWVVGVWWDWVSTRVVLGWC